MAHKIISRKGHENTGHTQVYIHADLALKERAIARKTAPPGSTPDATSRQTTSWRSSTHCDYAERS